MPGHNIAQTLAAQPTLHHVIDQLTTAGGRSYLVGGAVRAVLLGMPVTDWDVEVFGLSVEEISVALACKPAVGAVFGVFKLPDHIDVTVPRVEISTGPRHTDFITTPAPHIELERAAHRRDFTINAMMYDFKSNVLHDFYGGMDDLTAHIIQHVNSATFIEDPLRPYRAAQLASRLDFTIDPTTAALCADMDLSTLPRERVYEEWKKLLGGYKPSRGLLALEEMHILQRYYPELHVLWFTPQSATWHAEGNVFNHTMLVVDEMARISADMHGRDAIIVRLAALLHDLGKATTTTHTPDEKVHHYGHEEAGIAPARTFLARLTNEPAVRRAVLWLVGHHLRPPQLFSQGASDVAFRRLINRYGLERLEQLACVSEADVLGRLHRGEDGVVRVPDAESVDWFRERVAHVAIHAGTSPDGRLVRLIDGHDIMEFGVAAGTRVGELIKEVASLQEGGILGTRADALAWLEGYLKKEGEDAKS